MVPLWTCLDHGHLVMLSPNPIIKWATCEQLRYCKKEKNLIVQKECTFKARYNLLIGKVTIYGWSTCCGMFSMLYLSSMLEWVCTVWCNMQGIFFVSKGFLLDLSYIWECVYHVPWFLEEIDSRNAAWKSWGPVCLLGIKFLGIPRQFYRNKGAGFEEVKDEDG